MYIYLCPAVTWASGDFSLLSLVRSQCLSLPACFNSVVTTCSRASAGFLQLVTLAKPLFLDRFSSSINCHFLYRFLLCVGGLPMRNVCSADRK